MSHDENDSYKAMLGGLVSKRDRLDKAIEAMRNLIEIEPETRNEARERRATTIPRKKRRKPDGHGADRDSWHCNAHNLEFLEYKDFRKHYYHEHIKKKELNPAPKPPFKKHGLGCEPCELNFPNIAALEQHQTAKHGVRFSSERRENGIGKPAITW